MLVRGLLDTTHQPHYFHAHLDNTLISFQELLRLNARKGARRKLFAWVHEPGRHLDTKLIAHLPERL